MRQHDSSAVGKVCRRLGMRYTPKKCCLSSFVYVWENDAKPNQWIDINVWGTLFSDSPNIDVIGMTDALVMLGTSDPILMPALKDGIMKLCEYNIESHDEPRSQILNMLKVCRNIAIFSTTRPSLILVRGPSQALRLVTSNDILGRHCLLSCWL